jgi:hypothetical protein
MIESICVSEGRCRLRVIQSKMLRKGEKGEIDEGTQEDIIYCNKELHNVNSSVSVVWMFTYRGITHV